MTLKISNIIHVLPIRGQNGHKYTTAMDQPKGLHQ